MAYDPRADPSNLMGYDRNYKPVTDAGLQSTRLDAEAKQASTQANMKEDAAVWGSGYSERKNKEQMERMRGLASENVANISGAAQRDVAATQAAAHRAAAAEAANAVRDAARIRAGRGYAAGGPVKSDPRASRRMYQKGGPIF